jgi:hypothetical protein
MIRPPEISETDCRIVSPCRRSIARAGKPALTIFEDALCAKCDSTGTDAGPLCCPHHLFLAPRLLPLASVLMFTGLSKSARS